METSSITKKELAERAGVSPRTLRRWLKAIEPELIKIGYDPKMRVLNPKIAKYVMEHFVI